jgi:hypothetical protein
MRRVSDPSIRSDVDARPIDSLFTPEELEKLRASYQDYVASRRPRLGIGHTRTTDVRS